MLATKSEELEFSSQNPYEEWRESPMIFLPSLLLGHVMHGCLLPTF